jgi:hypothetical protein
MDEPMSLNEPSDEPDNSDESSSSSESGTKVPWRLVLGLGLAAVVSSVYLAVRPPTLPKSGLSFEPRVEQRLKMEQLKSQLSPKQRKFALQDVKERTNAELFTYMAGTSSDAVVLEASLDAIQHAYSSRSDNKARPDADLEKVLLQQTQSPSPQVASLAFQALRIPVMTENPRPELVAALCEVFKSSAQAPRRLAALDTLNLLRPDRRSAAVLATFGAALQAPEPYLVSTGLLGLVDSRAALGLASAEFKSELGRKVIELTGHADPGVRGRALHLLAQVEGLVPEAEVAAKGEQLVGDANGYVRGEAAEATGRARQARYIARLVSLTRDMAPTQYELTGWQRLDGSPGTLMHATPGRRRVAEAALFALRELSRGLGSELPRLELVVDGPTLSDEDVLRSAARAEAWAREVESKLANPPEISPAAR